ncbi:hypothetical protein ACFSC2_24005 [Flavobacterium artemisiae]|uniref:GLPGLI family protein n=2 Tax=Flavobacterium artemisiae TaxID=2126556 RepID=A0ABW4HKE8_9FLAO
MKKTILLIAITFLSICSFAQTQTMKNYDFNKGGYYILGLYSENNKNALRDSIGEFYTDDIKVLNQFKKVWTFNKPSKKYSCGYHYDIFICKKGQILESYAINLECKVIVTDKGYFYFDTNKLREFYGKLKKPIRQNKIFETVTEGRLYREKMIADEKLIMTPNPNWLEFEGSFRFTYNCKKGTKDCLDEDNKIYNSIVSRVKKQFPHEKFKMKNVGGSWTEIEIEITCNKTLSDQFNFKDLERNEYFGKWEPFKVKLDSYWIK